MIDDSVCVSSDTRGQTVLFLSPTYVARSEMGEQAITSADFGTVLVDQMICFL